MRVEIQAIRESRTQQHRLDVRVVVLLLKGPVDES